MKSQSSTAPKTSNDAPLYGFNVTCTAANKMATELYYLRTAHDVTVADLLTALRAIDDSATSRGWSVSVAQCIG